MAAVEDDIDIVGEEMKAEQKKVEEEKPKPHKVYGPEQFTEEDVLAVAKELEKEEPTLANKDDHDDTSDDNHEDDGHKKWCSQCQV